MPEQGVNGIGEGLLVHDIEEDKDIEGEGKDSDCFCFYLCSPNFHFIFLGDDMEVDSDCEGAADVDSSNKVKKKAARGPAENKSKKEHINVVFIGHVGECHLNT